MSAQSQYEEVPLLTLPDPAISSTPSFAPVVAPKIAAHVPDRIPCTFHGRGLTINEWVIAKGFYDAAFCWRYELGSDLGSLRFNRRVLAGFLRAYKGVPPLRVIPSYAKDAARAGVERAVWDLTRHIVNLRKRPKPLKNGVDEEPIGDGTLLLFR